MLAAGLDRRLVLPDSGGIGGEQRGVAQYWQTPGSRDCNIDGCDNSGNK